MRTQMPFHPVTFANAPSTALANDPEAVRVRDWRHKLQKTFLNDKGTGPKPEVRISCVRLFFSTNRIMLLGNARMQRLVHCHRTI